MIELRKPATYSEIKIEEILSKKEARIEGLAASGKYSSLFPYSDHNIGTYKVEIKMAFNYPMIRPMNVLPMAGDFVLEELDPMAIPCFPEPPWIKRCNFGIKFTDEIQMIDDVDLLSEEHDANNNKAKNEKDNKEIKEDNKEKTCLDKRSPYIIFNSTGKIEAKSLI